MSKTVSITQQQILPALSTATGGGRGTAFRDNPTPATAGVIVGFVIANLARLGNLKPAEILKAVGVPGAPAISKPSNPPAGKAGTNAPMAPAGPTYAAGAEVMAKYADDGKFYLANVVSHTTTDAVIKWADGSGRAKVALSDLRPLSKRAPVTSAAKAAAQPAPKVAAKAPAKPAPAPTKSVTKKVGATSTVTVKKPAKAPAK